MCDSPVFALSVLLGQLRRANLGLSLCMPSMQNTDGLFGQCPNITWLIVIVCPACTVVFGGRCLRVISGIINGTHPPFCDSNELSLGDFHYSVWRRYPRQGWVTNGTVAPPVAWISHDTASGLTEALL